MPAMARGNKIAGLPIYEARTYRGLSGLALPRR
jgi:hypothetical protein